MGSSRIKLFSLAYEVLQNFMHDNLILAGIVSANLPSLGEEMKIWLKLKFIQNFTKKIAAGEFLSKIGVCNS